MKELKDYIGKELTEDSAKELIHDNSPISVKMGLYELLQEETTYFQKFTVAINNIPVREKELSTIALNIAVKNEAEKEKVEYNIAHNGSPALFPRGWLLRYLTEFGLSEKKTVDNG